MNNIVLCGFMGCGKSTVGRCLADKTGRRFVDMDACIEEKAGCTVAEIFARHGEEGFRAMEHAVCAALAEQSNLIIAAGGGALTYARNVAAFKGRDVIVLLDVPLETIRGRLRGDTTRPLLQRPDRDEAMAALYRQRDPLYRAAADIVVDGGGAPQGTADAVLKAAQSALDVIDLK